MSETAVPYERMRVATIHARERFANAVDVRPMFTPASPTSDVCVEVWYERNRALVLPVDVHNVAIANDDARALLGCRIPAVESC